MRADRLGGTNEECLIYAETNLEKILHTALDVRPELVVIDSIQTIHDRSSPTPLLGASHRYESVQVPY